MLLFLGKGACKAVKRVICWLWILVFLLNTYPVVVGAASKSNALSLAASNSESSEGYSNYILNMSNFPFAEEKIVIRAADFIKDSGSKVELVEGFNNAKGTAVVWKSHSGSLTWEFTVPKNGKYQLGFEYYNIFDGGNPIDLGLKIDGKYLFPEMKNIELTRVYTNSSEVRKDGSGNEFAPMQEECEGWYNSWAKDPEGLITEPYAYALSKGKHTLTISSGDEAFALLTIIFAPAQKSVTYKELSKQYNKSQHYMGEPIVIEGEDAKFKTSSSLIAKADTSDPSVYPSEVFRTKINYIGSTNWQQPGQTLSWKIDVPEDGLYKLGMRFRQSYLLNGDTYRNLTVDGNYLFEEASAIAFPYGGGWQFMEFANKDEEPYLLYLTKGKHTFSMEVTVGPMAEINRRMQGVVSSLGTIYRKFVMIVGNSPDANRDYNLFGQIPDLEEQLKKTKASLDEIVSQIENMTGKRSGTNVVVLKNM